jgi:hypothetical protein
MADFLRSIDQARVGENEDEEERVNEAGISSAAFKKQLKKLTRGGLIIRVD